VPLIPSEDQQETAPSSSLAQGAGERGLRYGLRDGACQAVTQGSGEQYLSAFALLLHASPFQLSVLSALPLISAGNLCCCLWVISGGLVAAYLLQQNQSTPIAP